MCPILFEVPLWIVLPLGGAVLIASFFGGENRSWSVTGLLALLGAALGLLGGWIFKGLDVWVPIQGYGASILLGFVLGVWLAWRRGRLIGVEPSHALDVGLWGVLGGLVGGRLGYVVLEAWPQFNPFGEPGFHGFLRMFAVWEGGLVFFGAFVFAIVTTYLYLRWNKVPVLPFLDLAGPCFLCGMFFGRMGCLMRGCCYGYETNLPWGLSFPEGSDAFSVYGPDPSIKDVIAHTVHTAPLHPTQVYGMIGALLSGAFLYAYWPYRRYDGQIFGWMFVMAGTVRFFEEFFRADNQLGLPGVSQTLTQSQWIGLGLIVFGLAWLVYRRGKNTLYAAPQPAQ